MTSTEKLKELISGLTDQIWVIDFYLEETKRIPKRDFVFSICDLDDTLFSRQEQLNNEPELVKRRWHEGNTYMINHIGIEAMVNKYYTNKQYPQEIVEKLNPENSIILTAGIPEYQHAKRRAMNIEHIPMRVVWKGEDKILQTIRYILFHLQYIPKEIIIYEDRPQFFVQYHKLIEWILWCKLTIMYVEMDGNNGYKKIEEV